MLDPLATSLAPPIADFGGGLDGATLADLGRVATAWLGTYLLHSTVLLLGAWLLARTLTSARRREVVWRAALLGGFATAALQVGLGLDPALGRFELGHRAAASEEPVALTDAELEALLLAQIAPSPPRPSPVATRVDTRRAGPLALALGGTFALGSLALGAWVLGLRRRGQRPLVGGPLVDALAEFQADAPRLRRVALLACSRSETPHATGLLRPRIVVPERALVELAPAEQRAMLAHELAHLERRDPLWLGLTRAVQLLVPLQPLNALARRRLAACAEFLCDARAIERTGDRVALARSLTVVAGWIVAEDALPDSACAMASRRSLLGARVEQILDERTPRAGSTLAPRAAALCALACTAVAAPTIAATAPPAPDGFLFGAPAERGASGLEAAAAGLGPSTPDVAPRTPGARLLAALEALSDELRRELDALEVELTALRVEATARDVSATTRARIDELERGLRTVRGREMRIRALIEGDPARGVEAPRTPSLEETR